MGASITKSKMIHYLQDNLLDSDAQVLVNTVNTVGVMGKGIALQFKEAYPHNFAVYKKACKEKTFTTGQILPVCDQDAFGQRLIINFPTKAHWRNKSTYGYIETGLAALRTYLIEHPDLESIAIPPLGCGHGGLDWAKVKPMIEAALADIDITVYLYEPNPQIGTQLQAQTKDQPLQLTPARAMLLQALFDYETEGDIISLFVANKLAYFLQLLGQPMRLKFQPHFYGPYSPQLKPFVRTFNGSYLKGLEQNNPRPFDLLSLNYDRQPALEAYVQRELNTTQQGILQRLDQLLTGYKTAFSLEVLATVAWIRQENPRATTKTILTEAARWSKRKRNMLRAEHVELALQQLAQYAQNGLTTDTHH